MAPLFRHVRLRSTAQRNWRLNFSDFETVIFLSFLHKHKDITFYRMFSNICLILSYTHIFYQFLHNITILNFHFTAQLRVYPIYHRRVLLSLLKARDIQNYCTSKTLTVVISCLCLPRDLDRKISQYASIRRKRGGGHQAIRSSTGDIDEYERHCSTLTRWKITPRCWAIMNVKLLTQNIPYVGPISRTPWLRVIGNIS